MQDPIFWPAIRWYLHFWEKSLTVARPKEWLTSGVRLARRFSATHPAVIWRKPTEKWGDSPYQLVSRIYITYPRQEMKIQQYFSCWCALQVLEPPWKLLKYDIFYHDFAEILKFSTMSQTWISMNFTWIKRSVSILHPSVAPLGLVCKNHHQVTQRWSWADSATAKLCDPCWTAPIGKSAPRFPGFHLKRWQGRKEKTLTKICELFGDSFNGKKIRINIYMTSNFLINTLYTWLLLQKRGGNVVATKELLRNSRPGSPNMVV